LPVFRKIINSSFLLAGLIFLILSAAPDLQAAREIEIGLARVVQLSEDRYNVLASIANKTPEPREIILRYALYFYDRSAPSGDIPIMVIRKDRTIILKRREQRTIKTLLIREGGQERGAFRLEPKVRLRRQRPWNY